MEKRIEHKLAGELETAIKLAREAGTAIMYFYETSVAVEEKLGVDNFAEPVTEADRRASEIIVAGLKENFPDDGILSEELADTSERLDRTRAWFIDPIDGTRGFINRDGDFAVQIGLAVEGKSVLGIVYEPLIDRLYWAVRGAGAWLKLPDSEPLKLEVSDKTRFAEMTLAASRSHYSPKMDRIRREFRLKNQIKRGSVGVKVGLLALREADIYIHLSPRTKQWDTCAPQIILEEAGGRFTDIFGGDFVYNTRDVQNHNGLIASNGAAHDEIVSRLRPLLTEFGRVRIKGSRLKS